MALQADIARAPAAAYRQHHRGARRPGRGRLRGARSAADAPEIDGVVHIGNAAGLCQRQLVRVQVTAADAYDLHAVPASG
jgi:hypothetical protein